MRLFKGLINMIKSNYSKQKGDSSMLVGMIVLFCFVVAIVEIIKVAIR